MYTALLLVMTSNTATKPIADRLIMRQLRAQTAHHAAKRIALCGDLPEEEPVSMFEYAKLKDAHDAARCRAIAREMGLARTLPLP